MIGRKKRKKNFTKKFYVEKVMIKVRKVYGPNLDLGLDPCQNFWKDPFVVFGRRRRKGMSLFNLILYWFMKRGRGLTPTNLFPNLDMGWELTHQTLTFHSLICLL